MFSYQEVTSGHTVFLRQNSYLSLLILTGTSFFKFQGAKTPRCFIKPHAKMVQSWYSRLKYREKPLCKDNYTKQAFSTHTVDNNVIKGLGLSPNRRVSGQRLCLLILQISISADRDVPAFLKAGAFFLLRYLKKRQKNVRCIVEGNQATIPSFSKFSFRHYQVFEKKYPLYCERSVFSCQTARDPSARKSA